ncbi:sulfotransferase 1E1-like [Uloborus diversus]|uniref:sulfotransferase 1E1-like n=1 Tax=Uloborus diversus TaxID=327109 RepID=UPI002408F671|nr:sulfotransferase 1E1-like [Uloborus diversus]
MAQDGTTWLQEIVYSIMKGIEKSETSIEDRFPYLEFIYPGLSSIEKITEQRFLKTHLPYSLLPESVHQKKPRIIYMMRNPKDVAVSYYHFVRMMTMTDYVGDFSNFFQDFLNDEVPYGPIWKHYADVWEHKDEPNVLILQYEDFHKDIQGNIKKIGLFLGKHLTDKEVEDIAYHCSFSSMSNNPSVNYQHWDDLGIRKKDEAKFFRKGQVGDWRNYFNSEMDDLMNVYIENHFKSNDIKFCFDLNM